MDENHDVNIYLLREGERAGRCSKNDLRPHGPHRLTLPIQRRNNNQPACREHCRSRINLTLRRCSETHTRRGGHSKCESHRHDVVPSRGAVPGAAPCGAHDTNLEPSLTRLHPQELNWRDASLSPSNWPRVAQDQRHRRCNRHSGPPRTMAGRASRTARSSRASPRGRRR